MRLKNNILNDYFKNFTFLLKFVKFIVKTKINL